jgi:hypothetical protein
MCEACGPPPPEVKEAHDKVEEAIKELLIATGRTFDIMTDWVVITAQTELHAHNDSYAVGWCSALGQPVWKTKGMMQECLDNIQAYNVAMHLMED